MMVAAEASPGRVCFKITSLLLLLFSAGQCDMTAMAPVKCIKEHLDFGQLAMINRKTFSEYRMENCAAACLRRYPQYPQVLVSYEHVLILHDKFNCICAGEKAFTTKAVVDEYHCGSFCPGLKYRCGDTSSDLLSVYCLKKGCTVTKDELVCSSRLPHDHHGCVRRDNIDWVHAHNVRNFSAVNDHSACVWECKDNHPRSLYSLTRVVDGTLTCSCAYGMAFQPAEMVLPEFCKIIGAGSASNDYYNVNCVSDLDEDAGSKPSTGGKVGCSERGAVGCVYEEVLEDYVDAKAKHQFTLDLPESTSGNVNVEYCERGCDSMFGYEGSFVYTGVRYNGTTRRMSCWCLTKDALNSSMVGPDVDCFNDCGYPGSQVPCGGFRITPAVNIFCSLPMKQMDADPEDRSVRRREKRSVDEAAAGEGEAAVSESTSTVADALNVVFYRDLEPMLETVKEVAWRQNRFSRAILAIIAFVCIIVSVTIVYVCFSNSVVYMLSSVL